jgi:hypothetical protein
MDQLLILFIKKNKKLKKCKIWRGERISFFPPNYSPKSKNAELLSVFTIEG